MAIEKPNPLRWKIVILISFEYSFILTDTPEEQANRTANANLFRLVYAYRNYGHLVADLDPLDIQTKP